MTDRKFDKILDQITEILFAIAIILVFVLAISYFG